MKKERENDKKTDKRASLLRIIEITKFVCGFIIIGILGLYAVNEFATAVALHPSDNVDIGESIILESEGALTESRIEGVTDIFQLSEELSDLNSTHLEWTNITEDKSQTGFFCIAEDKSSECVYNIDQNNICSAGYRLKDFNYIWVDSFSGSFYTVINISGRVVDFSDYYILVRDSSANLASRLIVNCYEAEEVILKNTIFTGTLVAPNAHVTYGNTIVNGQVYAESSVGARASYRDVSFSGYYEMMSALKKAEFKNDAVRKAAVTYLKDNFPIIYGKLPDYYIPGEADLLRIKELTLTNVGIQDLTSDLQYFKKLQTFRCANSTVESVDFSGLKLLSQIELGMTVVNNLKFGELPSLLKLNVEGCVTDVIDISGCKELVSFSYVGTRITKLVLPENSKIIYLRCSESGFSGFTAEQCASLSELLYLDAKNNPGLSAIDLSLFPKLKKVDVTNCGITELSFEKCMSLYYVRCGRNLFTEIDISNAPALIYFEAYSKVLAKVDATGLFKRGIAAFYVYDTVTVIDNDPPPPPDNPEGTDPPLTESPGGTAPPDISIMPGETVLPSITEEPAESELPDNTELPESTEVPDVKQTPEATQEPVPTDIPSDSEIVS